MSDATTRRSFRPGSWFGVFGDHATVLLPASEKERVPGLWQLVDEGAGFDEVLDALISGGLRQLPGFVLISELEADTKIVIRGAARAAFTSDGERVELQGSPATTWVERTLPSVSGMRVEVEEASGAGDLCVENGLVRVSLVEAGTPVDDAPRSEPQPDIEPDIEPDTASQPVAVPELEEEPEEPVADPSPAPATPPVPEPPAAPVPEEWPVPETPAPPVPSAPEPPSAPEAPEDDPDHDGMTRAGEIDPAAFATPPPGIPGQPTAPPVVARPVARLVFSSGDTVEVDRAIIVGRAPEARRFPAADQPRLVTVPSPQQEISSTHVEFRPGTGADHGSAVVTDLGSTNGTVLVQPGLPPEDLQPGIAVQLIPGAIVDLGDGVTIQVLNP